MAIESRDIPMLKTVIENPDPKNKPNLRIRITRTIPASPGLNIYELILLERVFKNERSEPIEIDQKKLVDSVYVDQNQLARLAIVLSIENDRSGLVSETSELLVHLKASKYVSASSVQETIRLLETVKLN